MPSSKLIYEDKRVRTFSWVKDAAITYKVTNDDFPRPVPVGTHEYDAVLHAWVEFEDGETREWSDDWGKGLPEWAADLIDLACGTRVR